ncbi:IclR family transcriptional regulator [Micromonospora sp. NPDC005299]|uniref:IclR family transcriptional regulator n=1 Tax=Micromonospora sp. NPDC005299 TaxID=3364231 RepID=UPI0036BECD14
MTATYGDAEAGTTAAARVADVLLLFLGGPESLGVTSIANHLGLSKAVVHRILVSLVSRGLLAMDGKTRRYHLGPAAAAVGARALRGLDAREIALPVLTRLRDETGETTTLSMRVDRARVYVEQVGSPREIRMLVALGRRFPLHAGSSSKAILAFLRTDVQERILSEPLERLTDQTIVDVAALRDELARIRRSGVATSLGERQAGAGSVAAPLLGLDGYSVGAISVCGPAERFGGDRSHQYQSLVSEAAQAISRKLGWGGPL